MTVLSPSDIPAYIEDGFYDKIPRYMEHVRTMPTNVLRQNKIPTYIEYVCTKLHVSSVAYNF